MESCHLDFLWCCFDVEMLLPVRKGSKFHFTSVKLLFFSGTTINFQEKVLIIHILIEGIFVTFIDECRRKKMKSHILSDHQRNPSYKIWKLWKKSKQLCGKCRNWYLIEGIIVYFNWIKRMTKQYRFSHFLVSSNKSF